jgi:hypothetical protein
LALCERLCEDWVCGVGSIVSLLLDLHFNLSQDSL